MTIGMECNMRTKQTCRILGTANSHEIQWFFLFCVVVVVIFHFYIQYRHCNSFTQQDITHTILAFSYLDIYIYIYIYMHCINTYITSYYIWNGHDQSSRSFSILCNATKTLYLWTISWYILFLLIKKTVAIRWRASYVQCSSLNIYF